MKKTYLFLLSIFFFGITATINSQQKEILKAKNPKKLIIKKKKQIVDQKKINIKPVKKNQTFQSKTTSNLKGCWGNTFGSIMLIETHNVTTGEFTGKYSSTTGSSGTYYIHGYTKPNPTGNYPVTMTISWRNIVKGATSLDNSQYWTSIMTGVYSTASNSLKLMNVISSAIEFPAVQITESGNYPETLEFTKKSQNACASIVSGSYWNGNADVSVYQPLSDALTNGTTIWGASSGLLGNVSQIKFDPITSANALKEFAKLTGKVLINGKAYSFLGECSYLTPENKSALSITITYSNANGNYTLGLTGILDASAGTLDLLESRTQGYTDAIYAANAVTGRIYVKQ